MTRYPNRTRAMLATALFAGVSLLAACSGFSSLPGNNNNPGVPNVPTAPPSSAPTSNPTTGPTQRPTSKPTAAPTTRPTTAPTTRPTSTPTMAPQQACNVPAAPVPGTYTSILIAANLNGSTLSLAANYPSIWTRVSYTPATPTPLPSISPTSAPTSTPSPGQPLYVFFGTYRVTHNSTTEPTGCAVLVTTQNGAPLMNQSFNSTASGFPNLQSAFTSTTVATGTFSSLSLTNLGPTGGNGTFSLSDGSTGTLSFTSRSTVTDAAALIRLHR